MNLSAEVEERLAHAEGHRHWAWQRRWYVIREGRKVVCMQWSCIRLCRDWNMDTAMYSQSNIVRESDAEIFNPLFSIILFYFLFLSYWFCLWIMVIVVWWFCCDVKFMWSLKGGWWRKVYVVIKMRRNAFCVNFCGFLYWFFYVLSLCLSFLFIINF